jgi:hypothetical protein
LCKRRYVDLPLFVIKPDNIDYVHFFGALRAYAKLPVDWDLWPVWDYSPIGIETPTEAMKGTDYNPTANYKECDKAAYEKAIVDIRDLDWQEWPLGEPAR